MSTIWEGNAGDSAYNKLKELYGFFDILITNGTSYSGFLNEVITSYIAADTDNAN
jgi:hypothetical protein